MLAVAPRDWYFEALWSMLEDGRIVLVLFDPVDAALLPPGAGCVRIDGFGGFVITPRADDPERCDMTCIQEASLGGAIPQWVCT